MLKSTLRTPRPVRNRNMSVFLNFNRELTALVNFNRVAAPNYDLSSIEELQSEARITRSVQNYGAIKATVSDFASYIKDAKNTHNILDEARAGLASILSDLQEMRDIASFGMITTLTDEVREEYGTEFHTLIKDILTEANAYSFEGRKLLNGDFEESTFTVGPKSADTISINLASVTPDSLGISELSIEDFNSSMLAVDAIDAAILQASSTMNSISTYNNQLREVLDANQFKFVRMSDEELEKLTLKISSTGLHESDFKKLDNQAITMFLYSRNSFAKSTLSVKL